MSEPLNYKHLHYFWAVAREGSVTRAAAQLGMSPQTVSGQVSRLEQTLGRALFTQQGRNLQLTEAGRVALRYADQIFMLGETLQETLQDAQLDKTIRLAVGISDVLPKTVSYRLLQPALTLEQRVRLACTERDFEQLLADLAQHRLDLVLADRPVPAGGLPALQSNLLARCPVMIFATATLAERYRAPFPACLHRAPMLLPTRGNVLRSQLEQWFEEIDVKVEVVAEFEDGALLNTFGQQGLGLFPAPAFQPGDITGRLDVEMLGRVGKVYEHYYAITHRRKLQHPAVQAVLQAAAPELADTTEP
ncbi:MAG TPA: transcriptional activator NhaR [Chromobacteriaceae bacterium]|nr:transcriptional activator NhaR [Chromobacteriaceae bacterium]